MKKLVLCSLLIGLMSLTALARVSTVGWWISYVNDTVTIYVEPTEDWVAVMEWGDGTVEIVAGPFDKSVTQYTYQMQSIDYIDFDPWYYAAPAKILKSPDNGNHQGWYNKKHKHY